MSASGNERGGLPRLALVAFGTGVMGELLRRMPPQVPGQQYWPWLMAFAAVGLVAVAVMAWHRLSDSSGLVGRWSRRSRRNQGTASVFALLWHASPLALRRQATVLRPSLRRVSWWRRLLVPARELGTPLARVGLCRVWSPVEDVTLRIGGPRTGKTGELAGRILDAAGAVIATSTRTDLVELTKPCRERHGPVGVFNPCGLGRLRSTVTFDPLTGCDQPATAAARAADLLAATSVSEAGSGDREFWNSQARRVLASLLHAAALGEASMRDVLGWVADPQSGTAQVPRFLRRSPEPAYEQDALQFLSTNDRTQTSITATIMPALGWLSDATAAAATRGGFDVDELLAEQGTVYLLGAQDSQVGPLVTALTGHIAREARELASVQPSERLDPPLTLALDEAALICPIPLDSWTADMGGRGVTIHIAAQSRAQLRQRWGDTGAAAILNNAATLLIYGGTRDPDDLAAYATLSGERDEEISSFDEHGYIHTTSTRRVPVLSAAQIAQLPARRVLIVRRNMACAVGRVQMAWKRRDVRAEARTSWGNRVHQLAEARRRVTERAAGALTFAHSRLQLLTRATQSWPNWVGDSRDGEHDDARTEQHQWWQQ